jgi:hypothetical protein
MWSSLTYVAYFGHGWAEFSGQSSHPTKIFATFSSTKSTSLIHCISLYTDDIVMFLQPNYDDLV